MREACQLNFKQNFNVEILDCERVLLYSEDQHYLLNGSIYTEIAAIFQNGPQDERAIIDLLSHKFSFENLREAISRLKKKGFINVYNGDLPQSTAAFWSDINLLSNDLQPKITVIQNYSSYDTSHLAHSLEDLGITLKDDGDFFVVIVDNYISKELEAFNSERLNDQRPWMLLKPAGRIIWIGPIFEFGKTGCWNCLAQKLKENRRVEVDIFGLENDKLNIPSLPSLKTTLDTAMSLAATEVAKWHRSVTAHKLNDNILTFDFGSMQTRFHSFKKTTFCMSCQPMLKLPQLNKIPQLKKCLKKYVYDEGERAFSIDESLQKLGNIVSPLTGIVGSISHSLVNDEHICYTVRNLPLPTDKNDKKDLRIPDAATGKGKTKAQAVIGCIAEALERYNCTFSLQSEIRASYRDVKDAIHPHELLNFSENQYAKRDQINNNTEGFNQIPKRYDETEIGWIPVYSLTENRFRYVPTSYCYLSYPFVRDVEMCPGNSNGCASGNTLEEAVFYALLELVERDAVATWWYNRIKRPYVDLESFENGFFQPSLAKFQKTNRQLCVLDLTNDLDIPSYAAISWLSNGKRIFFGTGAHLNPRIGIVRAISELNQIMIRSTIPEHVDLTSIPPVERTLVKWVLTQNIDDHSYLTPSSNTASSHINLASDDFLEDIHTCLKRCKSLGLEVLLLDMSNPDVNFYTTRIIIPGLRHFWSRLGSGRLYETPVKLGWLPSPRQEYEMNPIPYFL